MSDRKYCTVDGCEEAPKARGLCRLHYLRWYRTGSTDTRPTPTHCRHGHPITPENSYFDPNGHRRCRPCLRNAKAAFNEKARRLRMASGWRPWRTDPTPHANLTDDGWYRDMQPLSTLASVASHDAAQRRYAAQNARDGYLDDPAYIAAVAAWRGVQAVAAD